MTPQGNPATSALDALVQDGALAGSWILDPARSEVRLETRHTWGLRPPLVSRPDLHVGPSGLLHGPGPTASTCRLPRSRALMADVSACPPGCHRTCGSPGTLAPA